jgi:hypothetical protein
MEHVERVKASEDGAYAQTIGALSPVDRHSFGVGYRAACDRLVQSSGVAEEREALELDVVIVLEDRFGHLDIPTYAWETAVTRSIDAYQAALAASPISVEAEDWQIADLYERLYDHELLTPLDDKWIDVSAGVRSAFRACVKGAFAPVEPEGVGPGCAVCNWTGVAPDGENECESCFVEPEEAEDA